MAQTENYKEGNTLVVIFCGFIILTCLVIFDGIVTIPWAAFRYLESYIWTHILGFLPDFMVVPHLVFRSSLEQIDSWTELDWEFMYFAELHFSYRTTWLYCIPLVRLHLRIKNKKRPYDKLKQRMGIEDLLRSQTNLWRYNRYLIKHNPLEVTTDINTSCFAVRDAVWAGMKRTEILTVDRESHTVLINKARAKEVFTAHLKSPIGDINDVSELHKLLIVLFGLREDTLQSVYSEVELRRARRVLLMVKFAQLAYSLIPIKKPFRKLETKLSELRVFYAFSDLKNERMLYSKDSSFNENFRLNLLGDVSFHHNDELAYSFVQRHVSHIFPQIIKNEQIQDFLSQHAFVETFLVRLLEEGRVLGKMPPNHFSWLKMIDRPLWLALNDAGLSGASLEACGVRSHYVLEYRTKKRKYFPEIDQVVSSLTAPKNVAEFDAIKVPMNHPHASKYPFDPKTEYLNHLSRLEEDPEYRIQQQILSKKL
ncbi:hypothetical protein TUMSATVNIG1_60830 (plasmid) [Vibrio nigripulchritudo]|uniref:secretion/conjugation apparatus DotM-related subunit n=1 Tax=Vibrio nigripulchritudo TaxID=28173 RepID=UPI00190C8224|nr:hypothetical protein [Vibrio nigripulchritudo]BCL74099.1 hypothetical protein VNTUMSATTG_60360 [Vibrio nigripulchritudo]BDU35474.1 hypothetical protein TUMSATVNIG1_60830 [Vibrio nigripulchritudo]